MTEHVETPPDSAGVTELRTVLSKLPLVVFAFDRDGTCTLSEGELLARLGLQPGQIVGASLFDLYGGYPDIVRSLHRALAGESFATNATVADIPFETYYRPLRDGDGAILGGMGVAIDVTERVQAEHELLRSERFRQSLLAAIPDRMLHVSRDGTVEAVKPGVADSGIVPSAWVGRTIREVLSDDVALRMHPAIAETLADGRLHGFEFADDDRSFEARVVAADDEHAVAIIRDITQQRQLEDQLRHQAFTDSLTELANRGLFRDRVEHALELARRTPSRLAVLFVDLDGFKSVNDSYGHPFGDDLLVAVAGRMRGCLREGDTVARLSSADEPERVPHAVARLGGDEFAVVLEDLRDDHGAVEVARRIVHALRRTFTVRGMQITVSASVGIAYADDVEDADALLRNADLAMYAAKTAGKNRYTVYAPAMHDDVLARMELINALRAGIANDELFLEYQPIVALETGEMEAVEALLRWRRDGAVVPPLSFVGVAEEAGLIGEIGAWVLTEACAQLHRWDDQGRGGLGMSVNVSPRQLAAPDFAATFERARAAAGLDPHRLCLEITETQLLDDVDDAARQLAALARRGVAIAVDDFGTGYASLNYLRRLPLSTLKIDRSFVSGDGGPGDPLLTSLVNMALALDLDTIAEGVETADQAAHVRALGCRAGQGYHFARPLPAEDVLYYRPPGSVSAERSSGA